LDAGAEEARIGDIDLDLATDCARGEGIGDSWGA